LWPHCAEFSHLEHVAFAGHHFIQNWIDEKPDEEAGDQSGDDHNGEWLLSVRSDAGGKRGNKPRQATRAVIMIGRSRSNEASRVAVRISIPSCLSLLM
jgi:hypothetical protein